MQFNKSMRALFVFIALVTVPSISIAQAYFTTRPVDMGSYQLDAKHTGEWKEDKDMGAGRTYKVLSNPNKLGHISITQNLGAITPAILSMVNNHLYLNLYEFGGRDQPAGFYVFLVEIPNGELKLMPLKYDLEIPKGMSLYDFLAQPDLDMNTITTGRVLWLSQIFKGELIRSKADRTGRDINIKEAK